MNKSNIPEHHLHKKMEHPTSPYIDRKHPDYGRRLLAYVTNVGSDTVSVIDILRSKKITDITVGNDPFDIDISPCKRYVYVSNEVDDTLSVIRTFDNRVVDTIRLNAGTFTADAPEGVRVSRDGRYVYVANVLSKNISVIDAIERRVIATISLPFGAKLLDITNDGLFAYVSLLQVGQVGQVAVVDLNASLFLKTIPVGTLPEGVTTSPTDPLVFVANVTSLSPNIPGSITAINTELAAASPNNIPTGSGTSRIAFDPGGNIAYATNSFANSISVIDVLTHSPLLTIPLSEGDEPYGIQVTPNGKFIVVANSGSKTLAIIDAKTYQIISRIEAGNGPFNIAILDTCSD